MQLPGCGKAKQSCHLPNYSHRQGRCFDGTGQWEEEQTCSCPHPFICAMQFGIVSNGMFGQPGYYTDVSLFSAWIARGQQVGRAWAEQVTAQPAAGGPFAAQGFSTPCAGKPNSSQQFPMRCWLYPDSAPPAAAGAKRAGG